nr:protein transport protein SEC16B homolog isoform X1 [Tanacetum cinerariifolium]
GGFSTNLAPAKIVNKLLSFIDSTTQRVVGLPPPIPSTSSGIVPVDHHHQQPKAARVLASQSTMAISSLMPSASMEPINQEDANKRSMHNRSASEPDFGRSPRQGQVDTLKENSADSQSKASGNTSRFGRFRFGSGLFQKTVGMVLKPRQEKQAKLGDTMKFYYDAKLGRWVEEGVDLPAEEAALPPPPTTMTSFQNGSVDYSINSALRTESLSSGSSDFSSPTPPASHNSGIPPIPAANQFSARQRTGVRSRYVDTMNPGGGNSTNLYQSPSFSTNKPITNPNPSFFIPKAAPAAEQPTTTTDNFQPAPEQPANTSDNFQQNTTSVNQISSYPSRNSPSPSAMGMQKYASMDDISKRGVSSSTSTSSFANQPMSTHSRRTFSWSGSGNEDLSVSGNNEFKPFGGASGMPPSAFTPNQTGFRYASNDDLQEVEL